MNFLARRFLGFPLRVWLYASLGFPMGGLMLINGYFATSTGTGMITRRIEARMLVGCQIDRVSWWPWAGLTVSGLRLEAPASSGQKSDLLVVEKVVIDPSWMSLFRGRKRWERVEIEGVTVDLSLEALREVLMKHGFQQGVDAGKQEGKVAQEEKEAKEEVRGSGEESGVGKEPVAAKKEGPSAESPGDSPEVSESVDDFEGVVLFSKVKVRMYSLKKPGVDLVMEGLEGEIPVWGQDRQGEVLLKRLVLGGRMEERDLVAPVRWENRSVMVDTGVLKIFGLNAVVSAMVRLAPGLPLGMQLDIPAQHIDLSPIFVSRASPLEINGLTSRNVLRGFLMSPGSFSGSSITKFDKMVFHDLLDGGDTFFERGSALLSFSREGIVARDIRAIGHDDSLLINGYATLGGEFAGTVRIVSSPERAQSHEGRVKRGSESLTLDFQDLVTQDRKFRDVRIEMRDGEMQVDLGLDRGWVSFFPALAAILGKRNIEIHTSR